MKRVPIGIERNRHPAGRRWNFAFGAAEVVDGLVRVLSFGFLHTRWPVDVSRKQTEAMFRKLKAARAAHATQPKEARGNGEHRAVRGRDEVGD